jgi:hypothetical protein
MRRACALLYMQLGAHGIRVLYASCDSSLGSLPACI